MKYEDFELEMYNDDDYDYGEYPQSSVQWWEQNDLVYNTMDEEDYDWEESSQHSEDFDFA